MLVINKASGSETARRSDFPTRRDSESDSESDSQDFSSSDSLAAAAESKAMKQLWLFLKTV